MKTYKTLLLILVGVIFFGCNNPNQESINQEYIDKVKDRIKEDAMGLELNYSNIEFHWIDTLHVSDKLDSLHSVKSEGLSPILEIHYDVRDLEPGNIFSKSYLSSDKLLKIRNWEKNNRGIPFQDYPNYYEFAFANTERSEWLKDLTSKIKETDQILSNYENIEEGNLDLIENVLWYYKRIDDYYSNHNPSELWSLIQNHLPELRKLEVKIDSLSQLNPNQIIHYKAVNTFTITNPLFGNARQEITDYFYFNDELEIISRESSFEF